MKYRIPLWDKKDRVVFIEMEGTGHPQERGEQPKDKPEVVSFINREKEHKT